jgi:hypothetical protein
MDKRTREAVRYLGFGNHAVDEKTLLQIQESFKELESAVTARFIYRIFPLNRDGETLIIEQNRVDSKALAKNLKGCDQIVLFAATLGSGVDRLIRRYSVTEMSRAVVIQACAAAWLEEYCDECQEMIADKVKEDGYYLRPRFSPGYGDLSMELQKPFTKMLNTAKEIGLTITDSYMMTPTKSVTALIGMSHHYEPCHIMGCEVCEKLDCKYRRC